MEGISVVVVVVVAAAVSATFGGMVASSSSVEDMTLSNVIETTRSHNKERHYYLKFSLCCKVRPTRGQYNAPKKSRIKDRNRAHSGDNCD